MDERVKRLFQGGFLFLCRIAAVSMGRQRLDETSSEMICVGYVRAR